MNIILFDDHQTIIDTLSVYFKNAKNYKVVGTFTKSKDILNFVKKNTVDVIISDLLTDEELGTDLISMLRKNAPASIIIVYSAVTLDFIKESCVEAGADLCISKTDHIDTLTSRYPRHIRSKKYRNRKYQSKKSPSICHSP
ncbi:MAG: response regulator transcription factor [Saprospiraceae bacterium]|nr:response regulator transcription factor [Saprospiraceae bacterium]